MSEKLTCCLNLEVSAMRMKSIVLIKVFGKQIFYGEKTFVQAN